MLHQHSLLPSLQLSTATAPVAPWACTTSSYSADKTLQHEPPHFSPILTRPHRTAVPQADPCSAKSASPAGGCGGLQSPSVHSCWSIISACPHSHHPPLPQSACRSDAPLLSSSHSHVHFRVQHGLKVVTQADVDALHGRQTRECEVRGETEEHRRQWQQWSECAERNESQWSCSLCTYPLHGYHRS